MSNFQISPPISFLSVPPESAEMTLIIPVYNTD